LVAAGGLNSNASRHNIILSRPSPPDSCRVVLPVHYHAIVQLGDTTTNYQIHAGDRVYVPTRCLLEDLKGLFGDRDCGLSPVPCFPAGASGHATPLPPPYPLHPLAPPPPVKPEPAAKVLPPPTPGAAAPSPPPEPGSAPAVEMGSPGPAN